MEQRLDILWRFVIVRPPEVCFRKSIWNLVSKTEKSHRLVACPLPALVMLATLIRIIFCVFCSRLGTQARRNKMRITLVSSQRFQLRNTTACTNRYQEKKNKNKNKTFATIWNMSIFYRVNTARSRPFEGCESARI